MSVRKVIVPGMRAMKWKIVTVIEGETERKMLVRLREKNKNQFGRGITSNILRASGQKLI